MSLRLEVGLITTNNNKFNEIYDKYKLYGYKVILINESEIDDFLKYKSKKLVRKFVMYEQTNLINKISNEIIKANIKYNLYPVIHHSKMKFWYLDNNEIKSDIIESKIEGFLDFSKQVNDKSKYDWDDIFIVNNGYNLTYYEYNKMKYKVSARDHNVTFLINKFIYYKSLVDLCHTPQKYKSPVDFTKTVSSYLQNNPEFTNIYAKKYKLNNILITAVNQGVFFRASKNRRQKLYWVPGLNAGIPFTPKPKDIRHEMTYMMHDFCHHIIPDLVFTGNHSSLIRKVYVASRLMSEIITLVLADMIFVDSLMRSDIGYETVLERKIYPIFTEIDKCHKDNIWELIQKLLWGSFYYCFYGDISIWESLMINKKPLEPFKNKYDAYFMEDGKWSRRNYDYMSKQDPIIYQDWWENVKNLRNYGHKLKLQSIEEFIEEQSITNELKEKDILKLIFNGILKKYIEPMFNIENIIEEFTSQQQLKNTFLRYMMGQSIIFSEYSFTRQSKQKRDIINKLLENEITNETINVIRYHYNDFLNYLLNANLINNDDCQTYKDFCPIFPPYIIDYDHNKESRKIGEFIRGILN
jgi:hypothetical protein